MKLKENWYENLIYGGTGVRTGVGVMHTQVNSAFFKQGEVVTIGMVPQLEIEWQGFNLVNSDNNIWAYMRMQGHKFSVVGQLNVIFNYNLQEQRATNKSILDAEVRDQIGQIVHKLFSGAYHYKGIIVVDFPDEGPIIAQDGALFILYVAAPCSEEEMRNYIACHRASSETGQMQLVAAGVSSNETSAGKVLQ